MNAAGGVMVRFLLVISTVTVLAACRPAALTQQVEARRVAADVHVEFTKAADASNRAVMADADDASATAAREARDATQEVERNLRELRPLLESLGYRDELRFLGTFEERFAEYRKLDEEILPLAVENSNLKAQRLSFGPAQEAAAQFRQSLDAAVRTAASANVCCAEALAARAVVALLDIQVLHAPHIAEAEDAAMTRMETQMTAAQRTARKAMDDLKQLIGTKASAHLTAALAAFDRFEDTNREILALSRRNSEVRSLALSLGRKRTVTAVADDQLRRLEEALAKHAFMGTR
jgi:hypothetical protein